MNEITEKTIETAVPQDEEPVCPRCLKPLSLCVCEGILPLRNKISLLILQHPQEQDRTLGTARLAAAHFENATVKIGLSWPSLSKIVGRSVDPADWAILYLGSAKAEELAPESTIVALNRKGEALDDQKAALAGIEGVIVLDGTWSQAKALWWRNPWMLRCQRVILGPDRPSRYGKLRREPRRDGLSTIESVAILLARLERQPKIEQTLNESFERLLTKYRDSPFAQIAKPKPSRRDWRGAKARRGKKA
jgi:DTW domain-containing protein YfiP